MRRFSTTFAAALATIGSICAVAAGPVWASATVPDRPNILLIVIDDLGYGDCSAYPTHAADIATPNIDRIAARGARCVAGYVTAPVCSPSRTGLITGRYQQRFDKAAGWHTTVPRSATTIAEHLHAAGYATMMIGKNDFGHPLASKLDRRYPLNHGYDYHLGFEAHAHDYFLLDREIEQRTPDPHDESENVGPLDLDRGTKDFTGGYATEIFTDAAISFAQQNAGQRPFFLALAYNAVHDLVEQVPDRYLARYHVPPIPRYDPSMGSYHAYYNTYNRLGKVNEADMRRYYLANLACLDDNIGRLLEELDRLHIAEQTMIALISDNGGSAATGGNNQPLRACKYCTYEGGIRVPFLIVWPHHIEAGRVVDEPVSALDLLPSFTDAAGAKASGASLDGIDLVPHLAAERQLEQLAQRVLYWKFEGDWAIRRGDWKLEHSHQPTGGLGGVASWIIDGPRSRQPQLFDLRSDPAEQHDLASDHKEIVDELTTLYRRWESTHGELAESSPK